MWTYFKEQAICQDQIKIFSVVVLLTVSNRISWTTLCRVNYQFSPDILLPNTFLRRWPRSHLLDFWIPLTLRGEHIRVSDTDMRNIWRHQYFISPPQFNLTATINLEHKSCHHLHLWRISKSTGVRVTISIHLNSEAVYPPYVILTDN